MRRSLAERRERLSERTWTWLAWRLPRRLVLWAAIRLGAHATTGEYSDTVVPEMAFTEALKRWPA